MIPRAVALSFLSLCIHHSTAHAGVGEQIYKLTASDGAASDRFGRSVAISNGKAIVGAYLDDDTGVDSGSAYLFDVATGDPIAKLVPDDAAAADRFGYSVDISGNVAVVGSYFDDDDGPLSGSAYLFDAVTGAQLAKLTASDAAGGDFFGASVGISGNTAIVGANGDNVHGSYSGSAYLFDVITGAQLAKLLPDDGAALDMFGGAVAISGNTAIVGAQGDDDNGSLSGAAYLFDAVTGTQLAKLTPNDGSSGDYFGYSVAISGGTAIVGSINDSENGGLSGSAYLFDVVTGIQLAKLTPTDGAAGEYFGVSVAISGQTAIVGAYGDRENGPFSGAAYLFDVVTGVQLAKLIANDALPQDAFGWSVGISGASAIVGAHGTDTNTAYVGSAYVFTTVPEPSSLGLIGISVVVGVLARASRHANLRYASVTAAEPYSRSKRRIVKCARAMS